MQILRKRDKCPVSLYFGNLGSSHLIGNLKLGYKDVVNWKIRVYNTCICTGHDAWNKFQQYDGGLMMIYHGTILKLITQKEQIQDIQYLG